jgi:hypothetical protein
MAKNGKAEVINGWTISQSNGYWQAVKNGVVGFTSDSYNVVVEWANRS